MNTVVAIGRRSVVSLACCALVVVGWSSNAHALGFGASVEYAHSWVHGIVTGYDSGGHPRKPDLDGDHATIGGLFDTNVARDALLNYRLQIGFQYSGYGDNVYGTRLVNTLGFGLYRTPQLRLWVGPSLAIGSGYIEVHSHSTTSELTIGGGPQLGLNWHVSPRISLTTSLSYNYQWVANIETDHGDVDLDNGGGSRLSLNVGFLFRTAGDLYGR